VHSYITRSLRLSAVPLLLAGVAGGAAPATAAAARARSSAPAGSFTISGQLFGVAATSAGNAWAVGDTPSGKTLIVHWNGQVWKQVPSPSPSSAKFGNELESVAATSASNAWAVGDTSTSTSSSALIHHGSGCLARVSQAASA